MINEVNVDAYVKLCEDKKLFHLSNAVSANKWFNLFNFIGVFLSASCGLSMTILTVLETDNINVAVVGGTFAFLIAVSSQIQKNYGFQILNYMHADLANDFTELESSFIILNSKSHNYDDYEKLVLRYLGVNAKTNIASVRKCNDFFCCCI